MNDETAMSTRVVKGRSVLNCLSTGRIFGKMKNDIIAVMPRLMNNRMSGYDIAPLIFPFSSAFFSSLAISPLRSMVSVEKSWSSWIFFSSSMTGFSKSR